MIKKILFICLLFHLFGCQKESSEWNPIFEDTNYDYFYTEIEQSLSIIDEVSSEVGNENNETVLNKLSLVKNKLFELKDYYVPLTTIRHKIYDAERFLKLKKLKKAEDLLNDSKSILKAIDLTAKNRVFDKVVLELESMIDEVILSLDDSSKAATYSKMKTLGEHINLMLSKGNMVLSGIEFNK